MKESVCVRTEKTTEKTAAIKNLTWTGNRTRHDELCCLPNLLPSIQPFVSLFLFMTFCAICCMVISSQGANRTSQSTRQSSSRSQEMWRHGNWYVTHTQGPLAKDIQDAMFQIPMIHPVCLSFSFEPTSKKLISIYMVALDYHSQAARKYNDISLRVRSRNGKYKPPQVVEKTILS